MKFGAVPLAEAEGAILAHSEMATRPDGKAYRLRKGTVLEPAHLADLAAAGARDVTVATLGPDDLHEDAAAKALAEAVLARGLVATTPTTGRVNLRAETAGVLQVAPDQIHQINGIDPGITIATLPEWKKVAAGALVATIKIIPYGVPRAALDQAAASAPGALALRVPQVKTATLIETRVTDDVPSDKGRRAIAARLGFFGAALTERVVVPHEADAIAAALAKAPGELVMILTGSATSDPRDTAPDAVRQAGGTVAHYGMPVDPGNLLFIGASGARPVIGLPGCARSPALNGADWVLERVICGVPVTAADIQGMGVGGLLKEIPSRPQPRG